MNVGFECSFTFYCTWLVVQMTTWFRDLCHQPTKMLDVGGFSGQAETNRIIKINGRGKGGEWRGGSDSQIKFWCVELPVKRVGKSPACQESTTITGSRRGWWGLIRLKQQSMLAWYLSNIYAPQDRRPVTPLFPHASLSERNNTLRRHAILQWYQIRRYRRSWLRSKSW